MNTPLTALLASIQRLYTLVRDNLPADPFLIQTLVAQVGQLKADFYMFHQESCDILENLVCIRSIRWGAPHMAHDAPAGTSHELQALAAVIQAASEVLPLLAAGQPLSMAALEPLSAALDAYERHVATSTAAIGHAIEGFGPPALPGGYRAD